jgi:hypothetical protein
MLEEGIEERHRQVEAIKKKARSLNGGRSGATCCRDCGHVGRKQD